MRPGIPLGLLTFNQRMLSYERIKANAEHLMDTYDTGVRLLNDAMREAMPWATALAMNGTVPRVDQLEKLCTQLLALTLASAVAQQKS